MLWYQEKGKDNDVVVSTRIRLARNVKDIPFPNAMDETQRVDVTNKVKNAIIGGNSTLSKEFSFIDLDSTPPIDKQVMAEEHFISLEMLEGKGRSVLLNNDHSMSIMLMEEDHIRLQVILSGQELDRAYALADKVDDVIEESVEYAFDPDFGYLTSCPTNTGTGLRASVMMHLPALALSGNLNRLINSVNKLGITVRGLYGEGSEGYGNLYQFSNQITMGASELEIINKLKGIVNQIIEREREMRTLLKEKQGAAMEDKVWRSYGLLKYARRLSSKEAKSLLSDVSLGIHMGILTEIDERKPLELTVLTEPASIVKHAGHDLTPDERDLARAQMIRSSL